MEKEKEIKDLLVKYHQGNCTDEELEKLLTWFDRMGDQVKGVWLEDDQVEGLLVRLKTSKRFHVQHESSSRSNRSSPSSRSIPSLRSIRPGRSKRATAAAAAAAAILLISFTVFFTDYFRSVERTDLLTDVEILQRLPGSKAPRLLLGNGGEWDLTAENALQLQNLDGLNLSVNNQGVWELAARDPESSLSSVAEEVWHTIQTPRASSLQVQLPDGSRVRLNAESSLTFSSHMDQGSRRVKMDGEAYFEVMHRSDQPFVVELAGQQIEVLGTTFNVHAYDAQKEIKTALLEGSIELLTPKSRVLMVPNQLAQVTPGGEIQVSTNADLLDQVAWVSGYFHFQQAGVEEIAAEIGRWYDLDFVPAPETSQRKINGRIRRDLSMGRLVEIMNYLGIQIRQSESHLLIDIKENKQD